MEDQGVVLRPQSLRPSWLKAIHAAEATTISSAKEMVGCHPLCFKQNEANSCPNDNRAI